MAVLAPSGAAAPPISRSPATAPHPGAGERAARDSLRAQVAKLERDLGLALVGAPVPVGAGLRSPRLAGPRLLSLGELERTRDVLAGQLAGVRRALAEVAEAQHAKRLLIEAMLAEPGAHRWVRVTHADIGEPGCRSWHVRPRLGLIGMLAGWWHVKVSSGCPLAGGRRLCRPPLTT